MKVNHYQQKAKKLQEFKKAHFPIVAIQNEGWSAFERRGAQKRRQNCFKNFNLSHDAKAKLKCTRKASDVSWVEITIAGCKPTTKCIFKEDYP